MDLLKIERRGGFAGLKGVGELDSSALSAADREAVEKLFTHKGRFKAAPGADRYIYSISRNQGAAEETVEVPEHLVPPALSAAVKDQLP